jgi:hypothetical protein
VTCETWADHRFGHDRVVATGTHPTLGGYVRVERTCGDCGRKTEETRWLVGEAHRLYAGVQWATAMGHHDR